MPISVPKVASNSIQHALLVDIQTKTDTVHVTNAYKDITLTVGNANVVYTAAGGLLSVGSMNDDLKATNNDIIIALAGIDTQFTPKFANAEVVGGIVNIARVFFTDHEIANVSTDIVNRFRGVITSFGIDENVDVIRGNITHTVAITVASINTILENRVSGQRTNRADRERYFSGDQSFHRVEELHNTSFDFGKEYKGGTAGPGAGGGAQPDPDRIFTPMP